jgi:hypothetical protein
MVARFVIEPLADGYQFQLRTSDGTVVAEGPSRRTRAECVHDVHEFQRLVAAATVEGPIHHGLVGSDASSSP